MAEKTQRSSQWSFLPVAKNVVLAIGIVLLLYVAFVTWFGLHNFTETRDKLLTYGVSKASADFAAMIAMLVAFGISGLAAVRIALFRGRVPDYLAALVLPAAYWAVAQIPANFDANTGQALKYCADRPDGSRFCLDHPGVDPLTKQKLAAMDATAADNNYRRDKGLIPKRVTTPTAQITFFDPLDGRPKVWIARNEEGCFDLFDNPGVHPQTGESLQAVTKESAKQVRDCGKGVAGYRVSGAAEPAGDRNSAQARLKRCTENAGDLRGEERSTAIRACFNGR